MRVGVGAGPGETGSPGWGGDLLLGISAPPTPDLWGSLPPTLLLDVSGLLGGRAFSLTRDSTAPLLLSPLCSKHPNPRETEGYLGVP